jgi:hypothetical protein
MTLSRMTPSIMDLIMTRFLNNRWLVIILCIHYVIVNVLMLSVIMLSVILLSVILLSVILLSVLALF